MRNYKIKLYAAIARKIDAYHSARLSDEIKHAATGEPWEEVHREHAEDLILDYFPHGSGIDGATEIDIDKSHGQRLIIYSSYHCMNEYGSYTHWIDYTITVKPCLLFGYDLNIRGNFSKPRDCQNVKEYLYQVYNDTLDQDVDPYPHIKD